MNKKPLLVLFLGYPGSGKSFFARQLAEQIQAVRLNGDAMRIALFKTVEAIEAYPDKKRLNEQTFDAIDYTVAQILKAGHDVVYDAHHNKRSIRQEQERIAHEYGAYPIVVWIKTPQEIALKRGQTRKADSDSRQNTEEKMRASMQRHMENFDEPSDAEKVITIDGTIPFDEQYKSFTLQLEQILAR